MKTKQIKLFLRLVEFEDRFYELKGNDGYYMAVTPSCSNNSGVDIFIAADGNIAHCVCVNSYREAKVMIKGFLRGHLDE